MKVINTVFAIHNHQPIGNFENVIEEAYQLSYRPFIDLFEQFPHIKLTQHWTGTLIEWLVKRHPDFIEKLREMVKKGQLELLTGSYYEAVLAIIPERDRLGQIQKLTEYIHKVFDCTPRGMWLAERVWEQPIAASLANAGVEFIAVDDTHFRHAGLRDEELFGYYITEEEGHTLKIIPIDKTLRYTVPFRPLEETLRYFQKVAAEGGSRTVVHADDGEKFGVWPKTYNHVYKDGWLRSFCQMLAGNKEWIRTIHFSDLVDTFPSLGRTYLPTGSYAEMMKWSLPPTSFVQLETFERRLKESHLFDDNSMFVHGGFWRNFLAKYPEANHMHKKMLRVSRRAYDLGRSAKLDNEIMDHIWAGQCNDPYWHGVFGGLYLPNLRNPVYKNLLQAEAKLDALQKQRGVRVEETDFDCDGSAELLVESDEINLYFKPSTGGSLVELDYKPAAVNLLDILSRKEEGYHRRLLTHPEEHKNAPTVHDGLIVKEHGLERHLHFDWYRHASLTDHFFAEGTTLEAYAQCKYLELGDFVNQQYESQWKKVEGGVEIILERKGAVWFGTTPHRITVRKIIRYKPGTSEFSVDYKLINGEENPLDIWFGVEFCIGSMAGDADDRYYGIDDRSLEDSRLRSTGEEIEVRSFKLVDEWLGIEITFRLDQPTTLWRFPIETVSLSEGGFERLYQCSVLTPHWRLRLENDLTFTIVQSVRRLKA